MFDERADVRGSKIEQIVGEPAVALTSARERELALQLFSPLGRHRVRPADRDFRRALVRQAIHRGQRRQHRGRSDGRSTDDDGGCPASGTHLMRIF
jgi:hypothetical protein